MLVSLRTFCEQSFQAAHSAGYRVNYEQAIRRTNQPPPL